MDTPTLAPPAKKTTTWSDQQNAIFKWFAVGTGNLIVRARAGTGKTTTILEGIAHAPEKSILLAAFNKRIADELKTKLRNPYAEAKTLHSLGFGFILRNWNGIQVDTKGQRVALQTKAVCGDDVPELFLKLVSKLATQAKEMVPFAKTEADLVAVQDEFDLFPEDDYWAGTGFDDLYIRVCALKVLALAKQRDPSNMIDFADMLYVPLVNGYARGSYDLVCIDEAQDMNHAQLLLAQRACKKGGRIVVVGDDKQAIYGFRGADSQSVDRLKQELAASELGLTTTYRCPKVVVAEAQRLVPDYTAADSAPVGVISTVSLNKLPEVVEVGDFVLSRKNAPLVGLCLRILRRGVRAKVEGKDIGKGLVALVKRLGAGKSLPVFMAKLLNWEKKHCEKWAAAGKPVKVLETKDRAETLRELSEGLTSTREIEARILSLFDDGVASQPLVVLSTVHKAKGLEAGRVFVLQDTLYPYPNAAMKQEERNIEYVAITRAKNELVWVQGKC